MLYDFITFPMLDTRDLYVLCKLTGIPRHSTVMSRNYFMLRHILCSLVVTILTELQAGRPEFDSR